VKAGADEIARRLTFGGFEVEEILAVEEEQVLEVNVTPNRGDCLSIAGLAREVSALFGMRGAIPPRIHRSPRPPRNIGGLRSLSVKIRHPKACPRYSLAVIDGVTVRPSPEWLVRRLALVGVRPINNIVDVTNYVLMELGQPLHAFDRDKIRRGIVIRRAAAGEKILTLDGEEQELTPDDLVIADSERAIALAGVMGGKDSEIDGASRAVALEAAFFEPAGIRRTARRLGIQTESSYRFERRVDPEGVVRALERAVSLIQEVAGGVVAGPAVDLYPGKTKETKFSFSTREVETVMGGRWPVSQVKKDFQKLSFRLRPGGRERWEVSVPSWRGDIQRGADLVEEAARLKGLEGIPITFPPMISEPVSPSAASQAEERIRHLLADLGLREAIHFSFLAPEDLTALDPSLVAEAVELANPLGRENSLLRPTLIPSLLKTASLHHRHKIHDVRLFELRKRFRKREGQIQESKTLAVLLTGKRLLSYWGEKIEETDFYDLKGILEKILRERAVSDLSFSGGSFPFLHPRKQAAVKRGEEVVGVLGEIHPDVAARFELKRPACVLELDWESIAARPAPEKKFEGYSLHPVVERDLALVIDGTIPAGSILDYIKGQDPAIWDVAIFDLYRGPQIPEGKKSLAFAIQIGRKNRTLTEEEVNVIFEKVVENVKQAFKAEVR
jgi:phenylalanyl-tRNA synthetase beta chain